MIRHVDSIVLRAGDLAAVVAFYRAVGVPLEEERHDDGPLHFACELGPIHFAVYGADAPGAAPRRRDGGASQVGFQVDSLEAVFSAAVEVGATVLLEIEDVPWGRRALVTDPDGRTVEFNQGPAST